MIYSGIDEAGLGPILGPYCGTMVTFNSREPLIDILKPYQKSVFYVDDSKKVYQGKYGFRKLELNVLSFFHLLTGKIPETIQEFIPSLNTERYVTDTIKLPISVDSKEIIDQSNKTREIFNKNSIELQDIKRTAVSAENFNLLLDRWNNKSVVCQTIMEPLILSAFNSGSQNIVIDKQGGRKFYKEYLESILNCSIEIVEEEDNKSVYLAKNSKVIFMAKADSNNFETALASMISKYMRECSMIGFNNFWKQKNPQIKETAGYYTDGMRFINDLRSLNLLPDNLNTLIRYK